MARKPRDYKAEERRRNELAKARGFKTRAEQRKKIERGEVAALHPQRVRATKTKEAQKRYTAAQRRAAAPKGRSGQKTVSIGGIKMNRRQVMQDWSDYAASTPLAEYKPEDARSLGLTRDEYDQAYWDAWLDPDSGYVLNRYAPSEAQRRWMVDIMGHYEAEEYEDRYGDSK